MSQHTRLRLRLRHETGKETPSNDEYMAGPITRKPFMTHDVVTQIDALFTASENQGHPGQSRMRLENRSSYNSSPSLSRAALYFWVSLYQHACYSFVHRNGRCLFASTDNVCTFSYQRTEAKTEHDNH